MPKVVLITGGTVIPPRGAYAIAHSLLIHGIEHRIYDYFHLWNTAKIVDMVRTLNSGDILGISNTFATGAFTANANMLFRLTRGKGITVVVGGEQIENKINYDVSLYGIGYAEDQFIDFVNKKFGRIKKLPYSIENDSFSWREEYKFPRNTALPVELSRNCIFDCKFCSFPNRGMKMPFRNMALVRKELDDANRMYGTTIFTIVCSTFNDNEQKMVEFFNAVDGSEYKFWCFTRLELLMKQKHLWPQYKKHIKYIQFGIETFNRDSGRSIGKGANPEKVKEWLKEVRDYFDDASICSNFICGLPHSSFEDEKETLTWLETNKVLDNYFFYFLTINKTNIENRKAYSQFDLEYEKHGYSFLEGSDTEWVRNDGLTRTQAEQNAQYLNNLTDVAPNAMNTAYANPFISMEELKATRMEHTESGVKRFPDEFLAVERRLGQEYMNNLVFF